MGSKIPQRTAPPLTRQTVQGINRLVRPAYTRQTVRSINYRAPVQSEPVQPAPRQPAPVRQQPAPVRQQQPAPVRQQPAPVRQQPAPVRQQAAPVRQQPAPVRQQQPAPVVRRMPDMVIPPLPNLIFKGQKVPVVNHQRAVQRLRMCFGWNAADERCDIDVSVFLLGSSMKVPGDEWLVFYGQPESPDRSVSLAKDPSGKDRQIITVDLGHLAPQIQRLAFVLTIHEAFEKHLNFSMMRDPYVRVVDADTNEVIYSYKMEELYESVISMTIGELYLHNGQWKFNPVGNGVNKDLAGQCAIYGVQIG